MDWNCNTSFSIYKEEKEGKSIDYKSMKDRQDGEEAQEVMLTDYNQLVS
jgi:hypothetical protein